MIDLTGFALAALTLLALPGPTNMLLAAIGASRGMMRALPQLACVLAGYVIAISFWAEIVGAAAVGQPLVPVVAKLVAAAFLVWSGWKLWSGAGQTEHHSLAPSLGSALFGGATLGLRGPRPRLTWGATPPLRPALRASSLEN